MYNKQVSSLMKFTSAILSSISLLILVAPNSKAYPEAFPEDVRLIRVDPGYFITCPVTAPGVPCTDNVLYTYGTASGTGSSLSNPLFGMPVTDDIDINLHNTQSALSFGIMNNNNAITDIEEEVENIIYGEINAIDESIGLNYNDILRNGAEIGINKEAISSLRSKMTSSLIEDTDKSLVIGDSSNKSLKIGTGPNPTTIHEAGLEVGGENLIRRSANGAVHIGKNSLISIEEGGRQKMWATNSAGKSIDIDITNGSRLLINGRDVEKSIDNVGALSAALGSVPAISADSPFTCGFGAGTHSNAYAISGGCASRVSNRVSVNAAIATVINNGTGDSDDNVSARAGFTFKLGKVDDSPKVAARKAAELHDKVTKLEIRNESLLVLLQAQTSRLERLEKLASGLLPSLGDRASSD